MLFFVFMSYLGTSVLSQSYSREALQAKYPGFGTDWLPMGVDDNSELIIGYFKNEDESRFSFSSEPSEVVTFTLFTRNNRYGTKIENFTKICETNFDKSKPTKLVTHGWMSSGTADSCIAIKDGFLEKYDSNVFIMDWGEISGNVFYPIPMSATKSVGDYYSLFVNQIVDCGVNPKDIHMVGHSLGAHVSGFAARGVKNGTIGRVTGLDPASPGFSTFPLVEGGRLNTTDADFVDVIHTCAGYLGLKDSIGHADFYPNGGSVPQPGCESIFEMMEACSHGRSWMYFAQSLISAVPFMAYPCDSFEIFLQKEECNGEGVPMGDATPHTTRGDYYLRTEDMAPFAIKDVNDGGDNKIDS